MAGQTGVVVTLPTCPSISRSATVCEAPVTAVIIFQRAAAGSTTVYSRAPFFATRNPGVGRCRPEPHKLGCGGSLQLAIASSLISGIYLAGLGRPLRLRVRGCLSVG